LRDSNHRQHAGHNRVRAHNSLVWVTRIFGIEVLDISARIPWALLQHMCAFYCSLVLRAHAASEMNDQSVGKWEEAKLVQLKAHSGNVYKELRANTKSGGITDIMPRFKPATFR
jgi:hypothetical protein